RGRPVRRPPGRPPPVLSAGILATRRARRGRTPPSTPQPRATAVVPTVTVDWVDPARATRYCLGSGLESRGQAAVDGEVSAGDVGRPVARQVHDQARDLGRAGE